MTMQEYKEKIIRRIIEKVKENLSDDQRFEETKTYDINRVVDCFCIKNIKYGVAAVFYPETLYDKFEGGMSIEEIVKEIFELDTSVSKMKIHNSMKFMPGNANYHKNMLEKGQAHIWPILVSPKYNQYFVEQGYPHREFLNLLVLYNLVNSEYQMDTMVSSNLAKMLQFSEEDLYNLAMETITVKHPGIDVEIDRLLGDEKAPYDEKEYHFATSPMVVITQPNLTYGASSLLDVGLLDKVSSKLDDDLIILPSSIHELLVMPTDTTNIEKITLTHKAANETWISKNDFLSDSVYFYDRASKKVSILNEEE